MVSFGNFGHQLDIKFRSEVLHVLLEVQDRCVNLHLVLPVVVSPFLLEFKVRASSWHQGVYEVDLNLVDVDDMRNVSTGRIKSQVTVDCSVVGRANLEGALDNLRGTCCHRERDRLLHNFQVALC